MNNVDPGFPKIWFQLQGLLIVMCVDRGDILIKYVNYI